MRRSRFMAGLLLLLLLGSGALADDEPEKLDDGADEKVPFAEEVNRAIDDGVKWLLARPDRFKSGRTDMAHFGMIEATRMYPGSTGELYKHPAGATALALYTLLKCGVEPDHAVIEAGFNWLTVEHETTRKYDGRTYRPRWSHSDEDVPGSYELSAMILALTAKYDRYKRTKNTKLMRRKGRLRIRDKKDRRRLESWVQMLVGRRGIPDDNAAPKDRRGWRYNEPIFKWRPAHGNQDLSSTQLAALALFAAHQLGVTVEPDVWFDIVDLTLEYQEKDGPEHKLPDPLRAPSRYADGLAPTKARGFMYLPGSPDDVEGKATGSMTACGIANLLLAKSVLLETSKQEKRWHKQGLEPRVLVAVRDGLSWLDRNWSAFENPGSHNYHIYYLYALERAMDLLNKQLVGRHLWYTEGAKQILERRIVKKPGVYWETRTTHKPHDVLDTCFALLFLKRATKDMVPGGVPITGE